MSKPKPGVCGRCGSAVVQPMMSFTGWNRPPGSPPLDMEYRREAEYGHLYVEDPVEGRLVLKRVRCESCHSFGMRVWY